MKYFLIILLLLNVVSCAQDNTGEIDFSAGIEVPTPDTTPPSPPTNLAAISNSTLAFSIKLTWDDPATVDLDSIYVYRGTSKDTALMSFYATIYKGVETYKDTPLTQGSKYFYALKAIDGANNLSYFSNVDSATVSDQDTTNDLYVSTAGSDLFNGLSVGAAKRTIGGALDIAESGDSIFVLSGTYEEEDTITVDNITLLAYDENNRPIILGGDTLSNFVLHEAVSADTTEKVYEQDLSSTSTASSSLITFYKLHVDTAGYLAVNIVYTGADVPEPNQAKTALYTLSGTTMTLVDSTTSSERAVNAGDTTHFNIQNGKFLTIGDYWLAYKANESPGFYDVPFNSAASSVQYAVKSSPYSSFPSASYTSVTTSSRTAVGVGIVLQKVTQGSGGSNYYAAGSSDFDGLYFGNTKGNKVTALDSLSSSLDFYSANDSVYTLDTVNVIPIVRNGLIVKADNVNLNNIDFELTKTALRIDTVSNLNLDGIEIQKSNFAIHSKNNQGLTLNRIYIHDNIQGMKDSSSSDLKLYNSIFAFNNNTNLESDADTLRIVNNSFFHTISKPTSGNRNNIILRGAKNIVFKNNSSYTGLGWVGEIDSVGAIDSMDYNAYGYNSTPDSLLWHIGATSYGSLTDWQANSAFDNNSLVISSAGVNWNNLFAYDFTLTDTSELIDKGVDYLSKDFAGNNRDATLDIGAYEYILQPPSTPNLFVSYQDDSTALLTYNPVDRADSIIAYQGYSSASQDSFQIKASGSFTKKVNRLDKQAVITSFNASQVTQTTASIAGNVRFHHDAGDSSIIRIYFRVNGSGSAYDSSFVSSYYKTYVADTSFYKIVAKNTAGAETSAVVSLLPQTINVAKTITGLTQGTNYDYYISVKNVITNEFVKTTSKIFATPGTPPTPAITNEVIIVNYSIGNDANSGDDYDVPIKTLAELQNRLASYENIDLQDTLEIWFNRGDLWNGTITLRNIRGTAQYPIIVKAYGTGADPILQNIVDFSGSGWTETSTNVWEKTVGARIGASAVWVDNGSGIKRWRLVSSTTEATAGNGLPATIPGVSIADVTSLSSTHPASVTDVVNGKIKLYSTSSPSLFDSVFGYDETTVLLIKNSDYVTVQNIKIQYCKSAFGIEQSNKVTIDSCSTYGTNNSSILAYNRSASQPIDSLEVKNCSFITALRTDDMYPGTYDYYWNRGSYVFNISDGFRNALIHNNYMEGGHHTAVQIFSRNTSDDTCNWNQFYDNTINFTDQNFGRAFGFAGNDGYVSYNRFYRNKIIEQPITCQIGGTHNYFYLNLWNGAHHRGYYGSSGYTQVVWFISAFSGGDSEANSNYFFNNTFYDCDQYVFYDYSNPANLIFNNLIVDYQQLAVNQWIALDLSQAALNHKDTVTNNVFYRSNISSGSDIVSFNSVWYTAAEFNGLDASSNDSFANNVQTTTNPLVNTSVFKIYASSAADAAGINITSFVPSGTLTDIWGNTVNKTTPNVGANQEAGTP